MSDAGKRKQRFGRKATTAAILDAAQELFAARGFNAVTVRDIAERADVSHALVHQYVGSKEDIFRAVLASNDHVIASAALDRPDLAGSVSLMMRQGLSGQGRTHALLVARSALSGVHYDRTDGRFESMERLVELAEEAAASASPDERAQKDLDPRLVVACVVSLFIGWAAAEPWVRSAVGLQDVDEAELIDGLDRVMRGILSENVPGVATEDAVKDEA